MYTAEDYAGIIGSLVNEWKIAGLLGLSDASAKAQEYLSTLAKRYHTPAERVRFSGVEQFSWINGREINLNAIS